MPPLDYELALLEGLEAPADGASFFERAKPEGVQQRALEVTPLAADATYLFRASDETPDRYGDVIRVAGWDIEQYAANPVVLAYHNADKPIGQAKVWLDDLALNAEITLAEPGSSPEADSMREFMRQGIVRAVSVGFVPTQRPEVREDPHGRAIGFEFKGQELLEISAVSIPANPNCTAIAKSFGLGRESFARMVSSVGVSTFPTRRTRATRTLELLTIGRNS